MATFGQETLDEWKAAEKLWRKQAIDPTVNANMSNPYILDTTLLVGEMILSVTLKICVYLCGIDATDGEKDTHCRLAEAALAQSGDRHLVDAIHEGMMLEDIR